MTNKFVRIAGFVLALFILVAVCLVPQTQAAPTRAVTTYAAAPTAAEVAVMDHDFAQFVAHRTAPTLLSAYC